MISKNKKIWVCLLLLFLIEQRTGQAQAIVSIPDTVGLRDSTIFLPVNIDLKTYEVVCYEFEAFFDPEVIIALGASKDSTLSENWSGPYVNTAFEGKIKVAGLFLPGSNVESDSIRGRGNLVNLLFKVVGNDDDSTRIDFSYFKFHGDYPPVQARGATFTVVKDIPSTVTNNDMEVPQNIILYPNYPDPFTGATTIMYQLNNNEHVSVKIFNLRGQVVSVLVDQVLLPDCYAMTWDGKDRFGNIVPTGLYFCVLVTDRLKQFEKITFIK